MKRNNEKFIKRMKEVALARVYERQNDLRLIIKIIDWKEAMKYVNYQDNDFEYAVKKSGT